MLQACLSVPQGPPTGGPSLLPVEPGRPNLGRRRLALLRRVADTIDGLGDVDVQDVTFHSDVTNGEDDLTVTVYYNQQPRRR
jgi:hypothetical protein